MPRELWKLAPAKPAKAANGVASKRVAPTPRQTAPSSNLSASKAGRTAPPGKTLGSHPRKAHATTSSAAPIVASTGYVEVLPRVGITVKTRPPSPTIETGFADFLSEEESAVPVRSAPLVCRGCKKSFPTRTDLDMHQNRRATHLAEEGPSGPRASDTDKVAYHGRIEKRSRLQEMGFSTFHIDQALKAQPDAPLDRLCDIISALRSATDTVLAVNTKKRKAEEAPSGGTASKKASSTCIICMDAPANVAFFPCRHMQCCDRCVSPGQSGGMCPTCRRNIDKAVTLFV